jgi:hypothetical protein
MDLLFSATEVFQESHGRLVYVLCIGFIILQFLFELVLSKRDADGQAEATESIAEAI